MDWNAGTDWLTRLVSLLLSLADCAAYAARGSNRVRRNVLRVLCPAEAAAFRIVVSTASHYGAPIPPGVIITSGDWTSVADSDDPEAAFHLADRFRALALALSFIAAWAGYFARRLTAPGHTPWRGWQCPSGLARSGNVAGAPRGLASQTRAPP